MHQPFKPAAERFAEKVKEKMQRTSAAPTVHPFAGAKADGDSLLPFCMFFFTLSLSFKPLWDWRGGNLPPLLLSRVRGSRRP
jgi:hypothetical protein